MIAFNLFFLFLSVFIQQATTQLLLPNVTCTWMAGSSLPDHAVVYSSLGVASPTADPGGRHIGCMATTTAASGPDRAYYYGGMINFYSQSLVGDMWMFDVSSAYWTTIHYSQPQNMGIKGQYSASSFPGVKQDHACAMMAIDNTFVLFGGNNNCMFIHSIRTDI